jgi:uncharacterized protein YwqG
MAFSPDKFPDFLSTYKDKILKSGMETVIIDAVLPDKGDKTSLTQSKFRGNPYFPGTMKYPVDSDGKPMILYAQINFAETPHLKDYPEVRYFAVFS